MKSEVMGIDFSTLPPEVTRRYLVDGEFRGAVATAEAVVSAMCAVRTGIGAAAKWVRHVVVDHLLHRPVGAR